MHVNIVHTYKTKVATPKEYLNQYPICMSNAESAARQEGKRRVEANIEDSHESEKLDKVSGHLL